jgi:hypothetical protein
MKTGVETVICKGSTHTLVTLTGHQFQIEWCQIADIIQMRPDSSRPESRIQFHVLWKNLDRKDATWEYLSFLLEFMSEESIKRLIKDYITKPQDGNFRTPFADIVAQEKKNDTGTPSGHSHVAHSSQSEDSDGPMTRNSVLVAKEQERPRILPLVAQRASEHMRRSCGKGQSTHPFLILCPLTHTREWNEAFRNYTELQTVVFSKPDTLSEDREWFSLKVKRGATNPQGEKNYRTDVVIMSYDWFIQRFDLMKNLAWGFVIIDELRGLSHPDNMFRQTDRAGPGLWVGSLRCHRWIITSNALRENVAGLLPLLQLAGLENDELDDGKASFWDQLPSTPATDILPTVCARYPDVLVVMEGVVENKLKISFSERIDDFMLHNFGTGMGYEVADSIVKRVEAFYASRGLLNDSIKRMEKDTSEFVKRVRRAILFFVVEYLLAGDPDMIVKRCEEVVKFVQDLCMPCRGGPDGCQFRAREPYQLISGMDWRIDHELIFLKRMNVLGWGVRREILIIFDGCPTMELGNDGHMFLEVMTMHLGFGVASAIEFGVIFCLSEPFEQEEWPFCSIVALINVMELVNPPWIMKRLVLMFLKEETMLNNPFELGSERVVDGYMTLTPSEPENVFNETYLLNPDEDLEFLGVKYGRDGVRVVSLGLRVETPVMKLMMLWCQKILTTTSVEKVFDEIRKIAFGVSGSKGFLAAVKASYSGRIWTGKRVYFFNEAAVKQLCDQASELMKEGIAAAEVFTQVREQDIDTGEGFAVELENGEKYVLQVTGHVQFLLLEKINWEEIRGLKVNEWLRIGWRNWRLFKTLEGVGLGIMRVREDAFVFTDIITGWKDGVRVPMSCFLGRQGCGEIGELRIYRDQPGK